MVLHAHPDPFFSETDLTDDIKEFDVPTLITHGDDQIVPINDFARLSAKIVSGATLKGIRARPKASPRH